MSENIIGTIESRSTTSTSNLFGNHSDEEDNNPFAGTNHMFASGISGSVLGDYQSVSTNAFVASGGNNDTHTHTQEVGSSGGHAELHADLMGKLFGTGSSFSDTMNVDKEAALGGNHVQEETTEEEEVHEEEVHEEQVHEDTKRSSSDIDMGMDLDLDADTSREVDENLHVAQTRNSKIHLTQRIEDRDYQMDVQIVDAGQYRNSFGKYCIGYTIEFNFSKVIRRYSEFHSLRDSLCQLLPTILVPPIPSKHSIIKYFLNPLGAQNDVKIIEKRKRLLNKFLNNCFHIKEIRENIVFLKFLNKEYSWEKVLVSPPLSILPQNNLLAPPLKQTKPSPLHLVLPVPTHVIFDSIPKDDFVNIFFLQFINKYLNLLNNLQKTIKNMKVSNLEQLSKKKSECGAYYNAFSLENHILKKKISTRKPDDDDDNDDNDDNDSSSFQGYPKIVHHNISVGIEKIGQAFDVEYCSNELITYNMLVFLQEPLMELIQIIKDFQKINKFRNLKKTQYHIIEKTIEKRLKSLNDLKYLDENEHIGEDASEDLITTTTTTNTRSISNPGDTTNNNDAEPGINDTVGVDTDIIEKTLQKNAGSSKTLAETIQYLQNQKERQKLNASRSATPSITNSGLSMSSGTRKNDRNHNGHLSMSPEERKKEMHKLEKELDKLYDCFELIKKDVTEVDESMCAEINRTMDYFNETWNEIIKNVTRSMIEWARDSLEAWKLAKESI